MTPNTEIQLLRDKIIKFRSNQIQNKDTNPDTLNYILNQIYNHIDSLGIENEQWWVNSEYQKISHAINSIYNYLYDPQNSNLDIQDAKIFASYVLDKIKWLKNLVEKIDNTPNKVNS